MPDKPKILMVGEKPKRAPTLYLIIAGKLIKGSLALVLALFFFQTGRPGSVK